MERSTNHGTGISDVLSNSYLSLTSCMFGAAAAVTTLTLNSGIQLGQLVVALVPGK